MPSLTRSDYKILLKHIYKLDVSSYGSASDTMRKLGYWCGDWGPDFGVTDKGRAYMETMLTNPTRMPKTLKRVICEYDAPRGRFGHLLADDPDLDIRFAAIGVTALEPVPVPDSPEGLREDMVYAFSDLDRFCTPCWLWSHMVANTHGDYFVYDGGLRALTELELRKQSGKYKYASETFFTKKRE